MADRRPHEGQRPDHPSRNNSGPTTNANGLEKNWERDLTQRFRRTLSTKRMNELSRSSSRRSASPASFSSPPPPLPPRHGSASYEPRSPSQLDDFTLGAPLPPPAYSSLKNLPLVPRPPDTHETDAKRFRNQLHMLSETPMKWENPGLLDEAMTHIPLSRIYSEADEETRLLQATAEKQGRKPAWAWQDCVIRALLRWFKTSFFSWVNNPPCHRCASPTVARSHVAPTPEERALGGNKVELYQCVLQECGAYERFPRYNDAFVLLQTKRGRCGEWANCFSMLCRAMGSRVRWVWNSEDHVWTEVYSEYRNRWVHVDACEGAFDKPLLYNEGWSKKIAYCIAFSADGAMDVTRRYCRNPARYGLPRTKCPEEVLLYIMDELRALRRRNKPKPEKFRLEGEHMREDRELRHYYVQALTAEVASLLTQKTSTADPDAQKALEGRQSGEFSLVLRFVKSFTDKRLLIGSAEWINARGENGQQHHDPHHRQP